MPDLPPKADPDQAVKTPPAERTEAYGSSGQTTADLKALDLGLRSLQQRYDLLEELGQGGMGIVYRARDRETEEYVALKILRPEVAARADIIERFKAELRLARKITHKNVCRTYELLRFDSTVVIAMEYVEGQSLRKVLEGVGGVSLRRGLDWASQICDALGEAHAQGVVHRDLKPENIIVGPRGEVKVMDFGIARSIDKDATNTGTIIGTPAYMAPEQAEGKPIDQRADVYSLGLILYELFTGRHAFSGDSGFALAYKQIHETPPPPSEVEPALPANIAGAIVKATEKDPANRFASVDELKEALTRPPEAAPALGLAPATTRFWLSRELQVLIGMAVFLFIVFTKNELPEEVFIASLLVVVGLVMALLVWPNLRSLRALFWVALSAGALTWAVATLIHWKIESVLMERFAASGLKLPALTDRLIRVVGPLVYIYPMLLISFLFSFALPKPISATARTKFPGRFFYRDSDQFDADWVIRVLNSTPSGMIWLVVNSALLALFVYAVLVLPFLELSRTSR
ncbi:MAG: serine/threonine-protein kinase [Terriglobales bacterium]